PCPAAAVPPRPRAAPRSPPGAGPRPARAGPGSGRSAGRAQADSAPEPAVSRAESVDQSASWLLTLALPRGGRRRAPAAEVVGQQRLLEVVGKRIDAPRVGIGP